VFTFVRDNQAMNQVTTQTAHRQMEQLRVKNRRAACRHDLTLPLQFRISDGRIDSAWKGGRMLDMSVGGILIETRGVVPRDSTLELAIEWPGLYHGKPTVRLLVIGSVVRMDDRGAALRILSHEFREVLPAVVHPRRAERKLAVA